MGNKSELLSEYGNHGFAKEMGVSDLLTRTRLLKQGLPPRSQPLAVAPSSAHRKAFAPKLYGTIGRCDSSGPSPRTFLLDKSQQERMADQIL